MERIQLDLKGGNKPQSDAGRSITLFLSLYLLVLAFFILLVSISTIEEVKSKALMDSLTSTFASVLPPRTDLTTFNATTGDFLAADEFQRQVTGLFSTVVGVEKVEVIQPGRLMRVEIEGDSLFETDEITIREGQNGFMNRLVSALSASPPGLRFEMEMIAPTPWEAARTLPLEQNLSVRRAGAMARDLLARGAPPGAMSIGLRGSDNTAIEMWFHIRALEENRIRFEDSPLIKIPEPPAEQNTQPRRAPITLQPALAPAQAPSVPSVTIPLAPTPDGPGQAGQNEPISLQPNASGGVQ